MNRAFFPFRSTPVHVHEIVLLLDFAEGFFLLVFTTAVFFDFTTGATF